MPGPSGRYFVVCLLATSLTSECGASRSQQVLAALPIAQESSLPLVTEWPVAGLPVSQLFLLVRGSWTHNPCWILAAYPALVIVLAAWTLILNIPLTKDASACYSRPLRLPPGPVDAELAGFSRQTGYRRSVTGCILIVSWILAALFGQLLMLACTLANYKKVDIFLLLGGGDHQRDRLAEQFLVIFIISAAVLVLAVHYSHIMITAFMSRCLLKDAEIVLAEAGTLRQACRVRGGDVLKQFEFLSARYIFAEAEECFALGGEVLMTGLLAHQTMCSKGLRTGMALMRRTEAGRNEVCVRIPGLIASILEEFLSKIYIYQVYCVWAWCFFHSWGAGAAWLALAIVSGASQAVFVTRRNLMKVQALADLSLCGDVQVMRDCGEHSISPAELVPGDLIIVSPESILPCDCILVSGEVTMDEAAVTGEQLPVAKLPIEPSAASDTGRNLLLAGTEVVEASSDELRVLAVVKATGGATFRAGLTRAALHPADISARSASGLETVYTVMGAYAAGLLCLVSWNLYHSGSTGSLAPKLVHHFLFVLKAVNPMLGMVGVAMLARQLLGVPSLSARTLPSCTGLRRKRFRDCVTRKAPKLFGKRAADAGPGMFVAGPEVPT